MVILTRSYPHDFGLLLLLLLLLLFLKKSHVVIAIASVRPLRDLLRDCWSDFN